MFTDFESSLIRERNERLLREVTAARLGKRLQAKVGHRSRRPRWAVGPSVYRFAFWSRHIGAGEAEP